MTDGTKPIEKTGKPVQKSDIEAKLRELRGEVDTRTESAKATLLPVVAAGAAVVLLLVFILGRRRGRQKTAIVEIRRF